MVLTRLQIFLAQHEIYTTITIIPASKPLGILYADYQIRDCTAACFVFEGFSNSWSRYGLGQCN